MNRFPKITIETLPSEISAAISILEQIKFKDSKINKIRGSVLSQVYIKLSRKMLTSVASKKTFKIKLEAYEAYYLEEMLRIALKHQPERYWQTLADKIHQKLA